MMIEVILYTFIINTQTRLQKCRHSITNQISIPTTLFYLDYSCSALILITTLVIFIFNRYFSCIFPTNQTTTTTTQKPKDMCEVACTNPKICLSNLLFSVSFHTCLIHSRLSSPLVSFLSLLLSLSLFKKNILYILLSSTPIADNNIMQLSLSALTT